MPVTIYTRQACAPCKTLKFWLNAKKIKFVERSVDAEPELMDLILEKTGYSMVPVVQIGDKHIAGLNLGLISEALML